MAGVVEIENIQPGPGEHRWVVNMNDWEEVDVNARTAGEARKLAEEWAKDNLVGDAQKATEVWGPMTGLY